MQVSLGVFGGQESETDFFRSQSTQGKWILFNDEL